MEVRVRERLIGALVLVAIVVLIVPAVLRGRDPPPPSSPAQQTRRAILPAGNEEPVPQEEILVPEPDLPDAPAPVKEVPEQKTATAAARPSETPAANAEAARPPAEEAVPVVPREMPAWAVQLGAFSNREKADGLVSELRKRGYAAFVLEYRAAGKVLYRVRVGPEQDRARADEIAARLGKDGFQPVVARHP
ncbi:MAG: SPOR domain-containing protein [Steroidobacteraceae bacterium]